jgi:hypothetical protein
MKYTILRAGKLEELIDAVNQLLADGWMPLGGVSASVAVGGTLYCQAMTRGT